MKKPIRRAGRPTKPGPKDEKATLSIRATSKLKDLLLKAAESNDRSLSQEAELRLEQSFRDQGYIDRLQAELGGEEAYKAMMVVGRAMAQAGSTAAILSGRAPTDWPSNPTAYAHARRAAELVLQALEPIGEAAELSGFKFGGTDGKETSVSDYVGRSILRDLGIDDIRAALLIAANKEHEK
jgi:hypothetical protein